MVKNYMDIGHSRYAISQNEIYGVKTFNWKNFSWKYLSLIGDEQVISLMHTKSLRIHRFCIVSWKDERQSNVVWEDRFTWFESSRAYRALDRIDGERMEFEWNILPGFNTLQLCHKDQKLMSRLSITPEKFSVWIIFMVQRHLMGI